MYSTSCELGVLMKLFRLIKVRLNETVKFCIVSVCAYSECCETRKCFVVIDFKHRCGIRHS